MFDIWIGDMNLTVLILIISVVVVLPVQLLLCFKVKSLTLRFLPIFIFTALAVLSFVMYTMSNGWDGLIYTFFAIYVVFLIFMCGIGWGIWAIARLLKKKKQ